MTMNNEKIGLWDKGIVSDRSTNKITGKVRTKDKFNLIPTYSTAKFSENKKDRLMQSVSITYFNVSDMSVIFYTPKDLPQPQV